MIRRFSLSRNQGLSFEQKLIKRVMDVVISAVLLVDCQSLYAAHCRLR